MGLINDGILNSIRSLKKHLKNLKSE